MEMTEKGASILTKMKKVAPPCHFRAWRRFDLHKKGENWLPPASRRSSAVSSVTKENHLCAFW